MHRTLQVVAIGLLCFFFASRVLAQNATHARTDGGREVILYPDGTWKYAATGPALPSGNTKPAAARASWTPQRGNFAIWYDESKWKLESGRNEDDKGNFKLIGTDGYAMIISEGLQIRTDSLRKIALDNAREAAPDVRIVSEERRIVNGKEVLCLVIEGTIQDIPFTYYGYYYGGSQGTIQVITFTGQSLFAKYKKDFTDFLNGLEIKD